MKGRRGFTLIELLVVIAIIAILASILFPVFSRAREKARQTNCLSNSKQLMLAVLMYSQDFDEQYPFASLTDATNTWSWRTMTLPYIRNVQIFVCPSKKNLAPPVFNGDVNDVGLNMTGGYGINVVHGDPGVPTPPPGASDGEPYDPAACIFIMESDGVYDSAGPAANAYGWIPTKAAGWAWGERHNDGANYGFCDGHAKWQRPNAIDRPDIDSLCSMELE